MVILGADVLNPGDVTTLLMAVAMLLGGSRVLGELCRKWGLPMVLGELLAGILLGQTVLGMIWPSGFEFLFPIEGPAYIVMRGLILLSATLLLLVAGLEVELSTAWRVGKAAIWVAMASMAIPFAAASALAWFFPTFMDAGALGVRVPSAFALFAGVALSITALPIIAKMLIDLKMFKSDLGMLVLSAAILNDVLGWMAFAVVMALVGGVPNANTTDNVGMLILWTVVFMVAAMTVLRWSFHFAMPYMQAHLSWPGGVMGIILTIALLCAAFTEWIGIHAIFGAFIAGVAIGDSHHLRQRTRDTIHQFITNIFAPIFFAGIGLHINIWAYFDLPLVLVVLTVAMGGKIAGGFLGARMGALRRRESAAIGFAVAVQGSMGIILGQLALNMKLIGERMFVAIIVVAFVTSGVGGPVIQAVLQRRQRRRLADLLGEPHYVELLVATTARQAIAELTQRAAQITEIPADRLDQAVWHREQIMSTGLSDQVAVPHARLAELDKPIIVLGRSARGIDFDASDGKPAHLIALLLTPLADQAGQLDLLNLIARAFASPEIRAAILAARSYTELLAAINLADDLADEHAG